MNLNLNETELRVLGCLIEKDRTTPDYYPLTLNALVHACNQKSNRDPVVAYGEETVRSALDSLQEKGWVVLVDEAGGRTEKYRHRFMEQSGLGEGEMAVLAELMLRGPQTAGEVKGRANRMYRFADLAEARGILRDLSEGEDRRVVLLPRQPGRKERRYAHLLGGEIEVEASTADDENVPSPSGGAGRSDAGQSDLVDRIDALEKEIAALRDRVSALEGGGPVPRSGID